MIIDLGKVYERLLSGDCRILPSEREYIIKTTKSIIERGFINSCENRDVTNIISISNLLYNNAPNIILPLNDDLYDRLLVVCRKQGFVYPVGAPSIVFTNLDYASSLEANETPERVVVQVVNNKDDMFYFNNIVSNATPPMREDFEIEHTDKQISRKTRNTTHSYDMCGTLFKCKYTLDIDAKQDGAYSEPSVDIFERDFIAKHVQAGIVNPNYIRLLVSLKADGISVEATVAGNRIITACTRGDIGNNEASDLTPVFEGYKFPRAKNVDPSTAFGIKFEAVITHDNLYRIASVFGKKYANPRNAVIGLTGGLDAANYRDYLTLIPLETSLNNISREAEVQFINTYYTKGIDFRSIVIEGNYTQVLYQLKKFVDEADTLRTFMPFQYDGVVVEYLDPSIRQYLGKKNGIPGYAIAIKFNPMKRESIFTHYTFSVGQDGSIVPKAHFKPVEFFGAIHDKTTVHSYARFKKLNLAPGTVVDLTLVNDVIVYITRASDAKQNPDITADPVEFPTKCPSCGSQLYESSSGDSALCINFYCPERCIARISNMLKKLNVKDFSDKTIRLLGINSFYDLVHVSKHTLKGKLGDIESAKFLDRLNTLKTTKYPDYRVMGAIGFTSIAAETWRLILEQIPLENIIDGPDEDLKILSGIKGIGPKTIATIKEERKYLKRDLLEMRNCMNIESSLKNMVEVKVKIRFTGFRDEALIKLFNDKGFDAGEGGVTKDTGMLVIPYAGFTSSKTNKALKYKIPIATVDQAYNYINSFVAF